MSAVPKILIWLVNIENRYSLILMALKDEDPNHLIDVLNLPDTTQDHVELAVQECILESSYSKVMLTSVLELFRSRGYKAKKSLIFDDQPPTVLLEPEIYQLVLKYPEVFHKSSLQTYGWEIANKNHIDMIKTLIKAGHPY